MLVNVYQALVLFALLFAAPVATTLDQACTGCLGSGISQGSNSFSGCGAVTIEVNVASGACQETTFPPDPARYCLPKTDCVVSLTRTWSGVPAGETVNVCVIQGGARYCIDPPLSVNGGSGFDFRYYGLECGSGVFSWSTTATCSLAPGGKITALASGSCAECTQ